MTPSVNNSLVDTTDENRTKCHLIDLFIIDSFSFRLSKIAEQISAKPSFHVATDVKKTILYYDTHNLEFKVSLPFISELSLSFSLLNNHNICTKSCEYISDNEIHVVPAYIIHKRAMLGIQTGANYLMQ